MLRPYAVLRYDTRIAESKSVYIDCHRSILRFSDYSVHVIFTQRVYTSRFDLVLRIFKSVEA